MLAGSGGSTADLREASVEAYQKYRVFQKEDGVWRQYIDDVDEPARYFRKDYVKDLTEVMAGQREDPRVYELLSDEGKEIFNRLPENVALKVLNTKVGISRGVHGESAAYKPSRSGDEILIAPKNIRPHLNEELENTYGRSLIHEIQHAIQRHSKMPKESQGSSPDREQQRIDSKSVRFGYSDEAVEAYRNNLGEREARKASSYKAKPKPYEEYSESYDKAKSEEQDFPEVYEHYPKKSKEEYQRDIDEMDIDYQKYSIGAVDKIRDPAVSKGVREAYEERGPLAGKLIGPVRTIMDVPKEDVVKIANLHNEVYRGHRTMPTFVGQEKVISDALRKFATDTENAKVAAGLGAKTANDTYIPNMMSSDAINVIRKGGQDGDIIRREMVKEARRNGATLKQAEEQAEDYFNGLQSNRAGLATQFNALHKPAGFGLPEKATLSNGQVIDIRDPFPYLRYARRAASDIKWREKVTAPNKGKRLIDDPNYSVSLQDYFGGYNQHGGPVKAANRLATAMYLQAWTGLKDFASTVQSARREGFGYGDIAKGLVNIVDGRHKAIEADLIRDEPYWLGDNPKTGGKVEKWVNNAADVMYKISGRKLADDW